MFVCKTTNDYGKAVDQYRCETCGDLFTVCPPALDRTRDDEWRGCLSPVCASYDPGRDADKFFDDGNIVSLAGRRPVSTDPKSLAAEIEAVLMKHHETSYFAREGFKEAIPEAAAEIAALQSRAFEDGARTVVLPAGWVAVPRRITTDMMLAAGSSVGSCDIAHEAYVQAIAAAPALPLQPEGERNA